MEKIIFEHDAKNEYVTITLNRPHKRNAISKTMIDELASAIDKAKMLNIKCLVIIGAEDKMFCAGGDLNYFHSQLTRDESFKRLYEMKEILYELVSFPVPTICLLNGDALGGGCELATACDIRIAKNNTKFGFVQGALGITPGWGGGVLLYEKVNPNFALQWLSEGITYTADELKEAGWVHQVVSEVDFSNIKLLLANYLNKTIEQMQHFKQQYKQKLATISLAALMNEEVRQCTQFWGSRIHQQKVANIFQNK
ncbi:MAG TPA: enoyl-CoA hydratase/isomerase family protein [Bacillota bacterium]|nr:enoyl-CoA hydratase/isomerase family protein [Bacillota bacterium]